MLLELNNNKVVFILTATSESFYWTYNLNDGIWELNNNVLLVGQI